MGWLPTKAERTTLEFSLPLFEGLAPAARLSIAGGCYALGALLIYLDPVLVGFGVVVALVGHAFVWMKGARLAPGGATPAHEDVWAPVDDDWLERVRSLEAKGRRWDTSPWDISSASGVATLLSIGLGIAVLAVALAPEQDGAVLVGVAAGVLLLPLWLNGMRSNWIPSELKKKGEALEHAVEALADADHSGRYEAIPMLALREGRRGHYPVDARLMLRPAGGDESFLGIQVQVSMNNVNGTDYPYLYAVVLKKASAGAPPPGRQIDDLVFEPGGADDVVYTVVRRYADNKGGWHTRADDIAQIVRSAVVYAETWT